MAEKCHIVQGQKFTGLCRHCNFQVQVITAQVMTNSTVINGDSDKVYYLKTRTGPEIELCMNYWRTAQGSRQGL